MSLSLAAPIVKFSSAPITRNQFNTAFLLSNIIFQEGTPLGIWSYVGFWKGALFPVISNAFGDQVGETYVKLVVQ